MYNELNTFEDRLQYGLIFEDLFYHYIKRLGMLDENIENISNLNDPHRGDFIIFKRDKNNNILLRAEIDIKSSKHISLKSIEQFNGNYFICMNKKDLPKSWVVDAQSLKAYLRKIKNSISAAGFDINNPKLDLYGYSLTTMASGDRGFMVKKLFENKVILRDFLKPYLVK